MKKYFTLFAILTSLSVFSQAPNWAWAKSAGGSWNGRDDYGKSICSDLNGNVFVTGYFFSAKIYLDNDSLTNVDNTGNTCDIFIAKYDSSGNILWVKSIGGTDWDESLCIAIDLNGNVLLTGQFWSPIIIFDNDTLTNTNGPNSSDVFIAKYDASGNVIWAKSAGGISSDLSYSISTDSNGNIFITGSFYSSTIAFGAITLSNADITGNTYDFFVAGYDAFGNVIWATSAGGISSDAGASISTDASGNIFVTGFFGSSTITFGNITLTNPGNHDFFVTKYSPSGTVIWANNAGGNTVNGGNSISTDASGNVFVTGLFGSGTINFGNTSLTNSANCFSGCDDVFITKYDVSGNVLWSKSAYGNFEDIGYGISTDACANVFITGSFSSPVIFFGSDSLTKGPLGSDIFVAKYNSSGNLVWAKGEGGSGGSGEGISINVGTSGSVYTTGNFIGQLIFYNDTLNAWSGNDIFTSKINSYLTANIISVNMDCGNGPCNGSVNANVAYGAPPYTYLWSDGQTTQTATGLCAGTYSVIIVDAVNDSTTASIAITNNPLPTVSYNQITTNMCVNWGAQTLSAGIPAGGIYSGTAVSGNTFNPSVAGPGTFQIIYTYTSSNGCTNSDTSFVIVSLCSGIQTQDENSEFVISPNPSSGKFTVQSENNFSPKEISITNVLGEIIYSSATDNRQLTTDIDLSSQPDGIYFVNVKNEKESFTQKIIIQK
ncbi:MAG: T9SS type A sorting domain-containing protein [Bacteroidetes bacterium]|nr:T9SS type A sorting domain-containing protein [Bacteroidota bacterium]